MSIVACRVTADRDHENADSLRVYQVEAPGVESTQIVANKSAVYKTGDVVAAALIGTVTADGVAIEKSKIRGVLSFGMLLGKTDAEPGTDLTAKMGATHVVKQVDESQGVVEESAWPRYTSIDSFLRVKDELLACDEVVVTEKAHGSNARFGFHGSRPFMVGTHGARVVDSRLASASWPDGHLVRKTLEWVLRHDVRGRVAKFREKNPDVTSLAVYGEICGWKCSDLHYGRTSESEVLLFGEVAVNGRFLDYSDAIYLIHNELFPGFHGDVGSKPLWMSNILLPVLYVGKPDLDTFKRLRDQPSALAAARGVSQISEGVVIRPTRETLSKVTLNRLVGKYKSPLYEERKSLRDKDPGTLPTYVTAYDLLADFATEERVRHVLAKAESGGMVVDKRRMRDVGGLLYEDIRKESAGEWPAGSETLDEGTLRRWTFDLAGETIARLIDAKVSS
jgi:phenylalanyl-tRNA synthetase beta chain